MGGACVATRERLYRPANGHGSAVKPASGLDVATIATVADNPSAPQSEQSSAAKAHPAREDDPEEIVRIPSEQNLDDSFRCLCEEGPNGEISPLTDIDAVEYHNSPEGPPGRPRAISLYSEGEFRSRVLSWIDTPPLQTPETPVGNLDQSEDDGDLDSPVIKRRHGHKLITLGWRVRANKPNSNYALLEEIEDVVDGCSLGASLCDENPSLAAGQKPFSLGNGGPVLNFKSDFSEGETIGSGSFGRVFTARHETDGRIVAVKETTMDFQCNHKLSGGSADSREPVAPPTPKELREKFDMRRSATQSGTNEARLVNELQLCEAMSHPRIVSYLGYDLVPGAEEGVYRLLIFFEYCSGGSVVDHLATYGRMGQVLITKYTAQLLDGLAYLHSLKPPIVHRDLKSANLVLTAEGDIKITDFGCSKNLEGGDGRRHSCVGTILWMAPELLRTSGKELSVAADIWSLGCCLIEMATGKAPWSDHNFDNMFHAFRVIAQGGLIPGIPDHIDATAADFIKQCLTRDPATRPSAVELQTHVLILPQLIT